MEKPKLELSRKIEVTGCGDGFLDDGHESQGELLYPNGLQ